MGRIGLSILKDYKVIFLSQLSVRVVYRNPILICLAMSLPGARVRDL